MRRYSVDKTDLPHDGRSMAETRLVPVILTLVAREDIERLMKGVPLPPYLTRSLGQMSTGAMPYFAR